MNGRLRLEFLLRDVLRIVRRLGTRVIAGRIGLWIICLRGTFALAAALRTGIV